jgi:hypothetical protein
VLLLITKELAYSVEITLGMRQPIVVLVAIKVQELASNVEECIGVAHVNLA